MTEIVTASNLNAEQVYKMLDNSEGKGKVGDGKLEATTWNSLMDIFGLNNKKINSAIRKDKVGKNWGAIASLKSYLKKADTATKQQVADYLNNLGVELKTSQNQNTPAVETNSKTVATQSQAITSVQQPNIEKTTSASTTQTVQQKKNVTLAEYNNNMPDYVKSLKPEIIKSEGTEPQTYIAPEGNSTIGYGHLLLYKPAFLSKIDGAVKKDEQGNPIPQSVEWKKAQLQKALKNPENIAALKKCLEENLKRAAKNTGINNVSLKVSNDLTLSQEQMDLLLNSDIKDAEKRMEKEVGKDVLKQRTDSQKQAVLDMYYNLGYLNLQGQDGKRKAPKFLKAFKEGDMTEAACELDINKSGGKRERGLHRRNYERACLLFTDKNGNINLPDDVKKAVVTEYNLYLQENGKPQLQTFEQAVRALYVV